MQNFKCHLADPKIVGGKVGYTRSPEEGEKSIKGKCAVCDSEIEYVSDSLYEISSVACSTCEPNWVKVPQREVVAVEMEAPENDADQLVENAPESISETEGNESKTLGRICESCGGPRKGRGYTHANSCKIVSAREEAKAAAAKAAAEAIASGKPRRGRPRKITA